MTPREVLDFIEIYKWMLERFPVEKVSTGGVSYDGMTALNFAAALKGRGLPPLHSIISAFSPVDLWDDLLMPGGF